MRLYLAGGEVWSPLLIQMGVRNQLLSFYYFREKLLDYRRGGMEEVLKLLALLRRAQAEGYRFMLDSGAFTYRQSLRRGVKGLPPADVYFRQYADFLLEHGDLFDVFVELDIEGHGVNENGTTVDIQQTTDWSYELMDLPEIGWRTMQIYHTSRGVSWLRRALANTLSPYLGIGSGMINYGEVAATIALARRWGKATHGFGMTKVNTDMRFHKDFFSVDSSTWLRSDKYGGTTIYDCGKFIVFDSSRKRERVRFHNWYKKWGIDFDKILADDLNENRVASITAWRELANDLERHWLQRSGKYPYLYDAAIKGRLPATHPIVMSAEAREKAGYGHVDLGRVGTGVAGV